MRTGGPVLFFPENHDGRTPRTPPGTVHPVRRQLLPSSPHPTHTSSASFTYPTQTLDPHDGSCPPVPSPSTFIGTVGVNDRVCLHPCV